MRAELPPLCGDWGGGSVLQFGELVELLEVIGIAHALMG